MRIINNVFLVGFIVGSVFVYTIKVSGVKNSIYWLLLTVTVWAFSALLCTAEIKRKGIQVLNNMTGSK